MQQDTVVAIATALGEAGIGIVRVSGPQAVVICDRLFQPQSGDSLKGSSAYRLRLGKIVNPETLEVIDQALAVVMYGPHSYTGEDVVEFQCHGGVIVVQRVLELVLANGARLADAGEFTKRAFLNGKLDLTQAEAVIDVIRSKTDTSLDVALRQLEGSLRERIEHLRSDLHQLLVRIEASIDFPEDDIPEVELSEMEATLCAAISETERLISTAHEGKVLREGIKTVIAGKPNVGKSSLLNRLLNENRALVTDIPGTTRDVIEETVNLRGIPFRILDTAGIRQTEDVVESLGVKKALELLNEADFIIHVLDGSLPLGTEDKEIIDKTRGMKRLFLINKRDLPQLWSADELPTDNNTQVGEISLLEDSLDPLIDSIVELVYSGYLQREKEGAIITRSRHKQALIRAKEDLNQALNTIRQELPVDLVAVGLGGALEQLGEITGETVRDTVIEEIFAQFCIGK